ncbi:D-alanyl-D-alanine-carboxypeptidase/endopeptidase AmpH [Nitratireductor sp. CAU 1489]|uniref:D-alanyl-D-alanine-carboxypeptidase/endopeptidase AmpH n=1 Tax=Nitratireductor arenosus TaxID=2682096 RepID=A0A844QH56_9HYPH|nr:D-alanyl-D-alanine-carboxypeptidase/endopeptidase AmpH [Nitratireductor arenosus]MVA98477.1 D-alanyl-D-alanine-carboxypeptidase/endopeptidase AmpH [Nitratireductor arenosus]
MFRLCRQLAVTLIAVSAAGLAATPATADPLLEETVSFAAEIFFLDVDVPGVVVAAVKDGETTVVGLGETRKGNGVAPTGDTVLRIGSITKTFTGAMLAHAVAAGEAGFTDPVAPLLPGALGAAAAKRAPIGLIDLATHAGGLPREVPRKPGPDSDPFSTITDDAFATWLDGNELLFRPGSAVLYSNFGFDLLSAALATAGKKPYPQLLAERVTDPLDMADTRFELAGDMADRLMSGHGFDGAPLPDVPSGDVITGSGGLRSTANDMLRWLQWHLDDAADGPAREVRFLDHGVYVQRDGLETVVGMDESGRMDGMGLAWVAMNATTDRPFVLQKAGALQGQMSYLAFAPDKGVGIFMSMNKFDFSAAYAMADFGNQLLVELAGH